MKLRAHPFLLILIGLYLALFLPFWEPVLVGFLSAAACGPLLQKFRKRLHTSRSRLAYWTLGLAISLLILGVAFLSFQIYSRAYEWFQNPEALASYGERVNHLKADIVQWLQERGYLRPGMRARLDDMIQTLLTSVRGTAMDWGRAFITQAPETVLKIFVFLLSFSAFLFLGPRLWSLLADLFSVQQNERDLFARFESVCAMALGSLFITGLLQAGLVSIGTFAAGHQSSVAFIFALTFVFSMIPILGAGVVPTALAIMDLMEGNRSAALILLITACIAGVADNLLRAWLFSKAAKTNPALSLVTLLGALSLMGFSGLLVAPVLEQLVMAYLFPSVVPQPEERTIEKMESPPLVTRPFPRKRSSSV